MELIRKPIHYTKEGKRIFDQFYLDEDYNVPDAKDDVQRIVMGNARVKTEEIRLVENYVRITGKVYFQILYVTATGDPKPAVLEGKLPLRRWFTQREARTRPGSSRMCAQNLPRRWCTQGS